MTKRPRGVPLSGLQQAFDEMRFGADRTLNLRAQLPTPSQATTRAESWLREQQARGAGEVLVITGRGNNSEGGVSPVRDAIIRLFDALVRKHVVARHEEHTPGSFVVTLAPFRESIAPPREARATPEPPPSPPSLSALDDESRTLLRHLAERSLDALGVVDHAKFVAEEMLRQFSLVAATVTPGPDRDARLRRALREALDRYE